MKIDPRAISEARQLAPDQALEASNSGPLLIIERDRPTHVLMTIEHYRRLESRTKSLAEALAEPNGAGSEFEPARIVRLAEPDALD